MENYRGLFYGATEDHDLAASWLVFYMYRALILF